MYLERAHPAFLTTLVVLVYFDLTSHFIQHFGFFMNQEKERESFPPYYLVIAWQLMGFNLNRVYFQLKFLISKFSAGEHDGLRS